MGFVQHSTGKATGAGNEPAELTDLVVDDGYPVAVTGTFRAALTDVRGGHRAEGVGVGCPVFARAHGDDPETRARQLRQGVVPHHPLGYVPPVVRSPTRPVLTCVALVAVGGGQVFETPTALGDQAHGTEAADQEHTGLKLHPVRRAPERRSLCRVLPVLRPQGGEPGTGGGVGTDPGEHLGKGAVLNVGGPPVRTLSVVSRLPLRLLRTPERCGPDPEGVPARCREHPTGDGLRPVQEGHGGD